jgi:hypothetical protein
MNKGNFNLIFDAYNHKNIASVHSHNYNIWFSCVFFVMTEGKSVPAHGKHLISCLDANAKTALVKKNTECRNSRN